MNNHFIELGKFYREWGVRGDLSGYFYNPRSPLIATLASVYIRKENVYEPLALERPPKAHQQLFLFKVKTISTPEAAKRLRQLPFYYPVDRLPPVADGDFYWFEAMGAEVWDDRGELLGTLSRLEGDQSVLVLVLATSSGQERLYPSHPDKLRSFDRKAHRLVVEHIPGLM